MLANIDTAVQELRVETHRGRFIEKLGQILSAIAEIPDGPPALFTPDDLSRLRELAEETVAAIESRIDTGGDDEKTTQRLAGTVYELRRRVEAIEGWYRHFHEQVP
jgi:hypothetical protein